MMRFSSLDVEISGTGTAMVWWSSSFTSSVCPTSDEDLGSARVVPPGEFYSTPAGMLLCSATVCARLELERVCGTKGLRDVQLMRLYECPPAGALRDRSRRASRQAVKQQATGNRLSDKQPVKQVAGGGQVNG